MAAANNMHNLTTLIKRLEAATSRLEDIATTADPASSSAVAAPSQTSVAAISTGNEQSATPIAAPAPAPLEPLPRSIEDYDELLENEVAAFVKASEKVGDLVEQQAKALQKAFQAERTFLLVSTKAKKPEQLPPELMTELHRHTSSVDEIRETNRPSPLFTHLSAVAEGIVALGWVMEKRPEEFVKDTLGGAQYYGNRVLKEYNEKDKSHVDFIQAYYKIFKSLADYVKEHHKMGLVWNDKDGVDALEAFKQIQSGESTPRAAAGGAPPPPPPPMPTFEQLNGPSSISVPPGKKGTGAADMSAVFDQLNQGSSVTSGLRKVDKSEMTHKNPSLRADSSVPQRTSSQNSGGSSSTRGKSPLPARKPESLRTKKPPRKELDGTKWIVENYDNTGNEIIEVPAELNHSILISRCSKCVLKITGKANAISIDNCTGLSILIDSLVSSLDVIKATRFAVQVDGVLPTIMLDQVDGGQVYLGEKSVKNPPEIFTSKCSSINVVLPPTGDDDSTEQPLPEQMRTYLKNGRLFTEIVEHAG